MSRHDQAALADRAAAQGAISVEQARDLKYADLMIRGDAPDGGPRHLVVEVSAVIDRHDVERASRRAGLLGRIGLSALAAVAGERIEADADQAARAAGLWRILDGVTLSPSEAAPPDRLAGGE
jgi:hypothetical protein